MNIIYGRLLVLLLVLFVDVVRFIVWIRFGLELWLMVVVLV